tara:strand:+ start:430 stop:1638 length:1209 start_codon:yes stop_codon:yes gene_type:complete
MLSKKNFFQNYNLNSNIYKKNLIKTKKAFDAFKSDFEIKIPLLQSYDKNYELDFSFKKIKKFSKYKNIIIFGMGGSILGSKCIYSFFKKKIKKKVFFFDNLDPNLQAEYKKIKNLKNSCFVIISKSGNTLETITNLSVIFSSSLVKNKLIIITEIKDNGLTYIADKFGAEIIEHKNFIGGRYSVLSEVGMLPAMLMNLQVNKFKNIKKFFNNKFFISSLLKNVASIYTLYKKGFNNSVILNYDSSLNDLGFWYQQLVGESLSKKGEGIMPILSPSPKDHHSMMQLYLDGPKDKIYTFFSSINEKRKYKISKNFITNDMNFLKNKNLNSVLMAQRKATTNIFKKNKIPFREFIFNKNREEELGQIFTFFVLETILLGYLLNINVFDQPAVEQIKFETKKILSR